MNTVGYLNLSALAYVNFSATHKGKSIGALIEEYEVISKDDLNKNLNSPLSRTPPILSAPTN